MAGRHGTAASKRHVLTQAEPSQAEGIADAITIKDGDLYFLCRRDGSVPTSPRHGLGLYYKDCRYLSGYQVRLSGVELESLGANSRDGFRSVFQLTNPEIPARGKRKQVPKQRLGILWRHLLDPRSRLMRDEFLVENYDRVPCNASLDLTFAADFHDVFAIRGLTDQEPGTLRPMTRQRGHLVFGYDGADQRYRELRVEFSERPSAWHENGARFSWELGPGESARLRINLLVRESEQDADPEQPDGEPGGMEASEQEHHRSISDWMEGFPEVRSGNLLVEATMDRSLRDLRALRMQIDGHQFFGAGVPWFATLFGRDSLLCGLATLAYRPEFAAETLRLLARFQGVKEDSWTEEAPGKILHELRRGELARIGAIPHSPFYGTVDATPLFVVLMGEYLRWTGDLDLVRELRPNLEAALRWMDDFGDSDGDGYLDYGRPGDHPVVNEGWKDSGTAIVNTDGTDARPPVALVEVQGLAYRARLEAATLFESLGEPDRAARLRSRADDLRTRFNQDFWLPDQQFYALALQQGGAPVSVISSNPGQALWTGIIPPERVPNVVNRLMQEDMFSGWGIRTLATSEAGYNPVSYHRGTVWPHDTALIAAGFRNHGHGRDACRLFAALLEAADNFDDYRLPELFSGYPSSFGMPVRYPVACHPQAWAASSIPLLLATLLGLEPDAPRGRLRILSPWLPDNVPWVTFRRLRVGQAELDLMFSRGKDGRLEVNVERQAGPLDIEFS